MSKHEGQRVSCRSRRGHLAAIRMGVATLLCATLQAGRAADLQWAPDKPDVIAFKPVTTKYVRLVLTGAGIQPCLDEVEILAPGFPPEMVDDEPEEPGYEVQVKGR